MFYFICRPCFIRLPLKAYSSPERQTNKTQTRDELILATKAIKYRYFKEYSCE
ncbi:hypothetical protein IX321_002321 [Bacteroides pyogenes]|nr:hypothetical protein [Bacteroides pyogenes]MBR8718359.1 hypothetical protein [Bacteroides pyogenes]MBR8747846.1 hypothetical protein [Bacteroides pyogenes]MBR8758152.1 hypothetical protein [Bacteroides pyogenes]MBR8781378.1 hypothetical protein [Bacteroides pyogenes]